MKQQLVAIAFLFSLVLAACGSRDEGFENDTFVEGPYKVGDSTLIALDRNFDELVFFRPELDGLKVDRVDIDESCNYVATLSHKPRVVLFCSDDSELMVLDEQGNLEGSFQLDQRFNSFTFAPKEDVAVGYFEVGKNLPDQLLVNQGEIAIIRLNEESKEGKNPVHLILPTYGQAAFGAYISPEVALGKAKYRLLFMTWPSYVTIIDLNDPDRGVISIPLRTPDSFEDVTPGDLYFTTHEQFVRAAFIDQEKGDVYQIEVDVTKFEQPALATKVKVIPIQGRAAAIKPLKLDGQLRYVILTWQPHGFAIIDPELSNVDYYPLGGIIPTGMYFFEADIDGQNTQMAIIWSETGTTRYYVVELSNLDTKKGMAIHAYNVPYSIEFILPAPQAGTYVVFHESSAQTISIVKATDGSVVSLGATGVIQGFSLSEDGTEVYLLTRRVGNIYLARLNLIDLSSRFVQIPQNPKTVFPLSKAGCLVVAYGNLTRLLVVPFDFTSPKDIVEYQNPVLAGLMD